MLVNTYSLIVGIDGYSVDYFNDEIKRKDLSEILKLDNNLLTTQSFDVPYFVKNCSFTCIRNGYKQGCRPTSIVCNRNITYGNTLFLKQVRKPGKSDVWQGFEHSELMDLVKSIQLITVDGLVLSVDKTIGLVTKELNQLFMRHGTNKDD